MEDKIYFGSEPGYYKGALHFHTTWSDGAREPEEVIRCYQSCGYQFAVWSDHDIFIRTNEFDTSDFITIGGMERGGLNPQWEENDNIGFHFGCIEDETVKAAQRYEHLRKFPYLQKWEGDQSVTDCVQRMKEHGNLVILNHPEWHMTAFEEVLKEDYFAIEIFNYATEWSTVTSYGTAYLDYALQNGKKVFLTASDDAHEFDESFRTKDFNGGWIVVNSPHLDKQSIVLNIKKGNYYASSGPEIYEIRIMDGMLKIKCSPCRFIMFKSWPERSEFLCERRENTPLTEATQKIKPHMRYIRVECIDFEGKVAWSNPIFLDERAE